MTRGQNTFDSLVFCSRFYFSKRSKGQIFLLYFVLSTGNYRRKIKLTSHTYTHTQTLKKFRPGIPKPTCSPRFRRESTQFYAQGEMSGHHPLDCPTRRNPFPAFILRNSPLPKSVPSHNVLTIFKICVAMGHVQEAGSVITKGRKTMICRSTCRM